jgi:Xaa-Pro aminopeptidase
MTLPRPDFAAHRARVLAQLPEDEALLVFGNPLRTRSHDTEHRYRPSSDLWWLTGWPEPECALFLRPGEQPLTLFVQPRDKEMETWVGRRHGPQGARERFGADAAYSIHELDRELPRLLQGVRALHYEIGAHASRDARVLKAIAKVGKPARRAGLPLPTTFHHPAVLLHEARLFKTEAEIAVLREAARITAEAHTSLMRAGRPGVFEYELEAMLDAAFRRSGGTGPGYTHIVAAGDNATILHYIENDDRIEDGELVLIDAGGEVGFYTADVTRTWPANGRFSEIQRRAYQHVLDAQHLAIAAVQPGARFSDVHDAAVIRLTEGMLDLGLLHGSLEDNLRRQTFKRYYMHGTSHWLGLDVHDLGAYIGADGSRRLEPGMVLTVEPGLYVAADDADAPEALRGLGIRIEDDVLVTAEGHEVLTAACPKDIAEIEEICQSEVAAR